MHRSHALAAAAVAVISLGACGSDTTEGGADVPENTDASTNQPPLTSDESPSTEPVEPPGSTPDDGATSAPPEVAVETAPAATDATDDTNDTSVDTATDTVADGDGATSTPDRLGTLAATDLAERLDLAVDEIEIVAVDEVTWPDASLGCPQKDFQYAQVLTPGIRIELSAQGTTYAYHAGSGRDPFFCLDPQSPV